MVLLALNRRGLIEFGHVNDEAQHQIVELVHYLIFQILSVHFTILEMYKIVSGVCLTKKVFHKRYIHVYK